MVCPREQWIHLVPGGGCSLRAPFLDPLPLPFFPAQEVVEEQEVRALATSPWELDLGTETLAPNRHGGFAHCNEMKQKTPFWRLVLQMISFHDYTAEIILPSGFSSVLITPRMATAKSLPA